MTILFGFVTSLHDRWSRILGILWFGLVLFRLCVWVGWLGCVCIGELEDMSSLSYFAGLTDILEFSIKRPCSSLMAVVQDWGQGSSIAQKQISKVGVFGLSGRICLLWLHEFWIFWIGQGWSRRVEGGWWSKWGLLEVDEVWVPSIDNRPFEPLVSLSRISHFLAYLSFFF